MLFTLQVGLEDLKNLPLEMRQKIQRALDLTPPAQPVQTPAPMPSQPWVQQPPQPEWQANPAQPAMFAPPQWQAPPAPQFQAPPVKQPTVQNGVPTFAADRSGPAAQSVFRDVLTGQTGAIPVAPGGPVVPQVDSVAAPPLVAPIGAIPTTPGPMATPTASVVRAAAVKAFNGGLKDAVNAAMGETGINIAGLTDQNAGVLANALRQKGVTV